MKSLTFNGVRKPWLMMLRGRSKPPFASISRNLLTIPGRHGALLRSSQKQPLVINQPIGFTTVDDLDALSLKDELAEWLVTDEPCPLTFDDEPGRTYYAIVANTLEDFENMAGFKQGVIQFLCLDPFGYSEELTHDTSLNPTVINDSTAETYPIFEVEVLQPITQLEITNNSLVDKQGASPSIVLGKSASVEQTKFVPEELIFQDSMQSTSTWQAGAEVDNGYIAGEIAVDSKGFYPKAFGTVIEPKNWQGPSLQRGIGTSLQDFKADIRLENLNTEGKTGSMAIYLRDANGNKIANIGFGDVWSDKDENFGHGQLGNYYEGPRVDAYAKYQHVWNDFDGLVRVIREGSQWRFYYARIENGVHKWVHSTTKIIDANGLYTAPVTSIQVHFRIWPDSNNSNMHIKEIKLYRINKPTNNNDIRYIAQAGDNLTIYTKESSVLKNGEHADDLINLSSQMFPFTKGINHLGITPGGGSVKVKARYRKAFL